MANAGLLLPATLAQHLGLRELVEHHLDLGGAPGRANTGDRMLTLVASALAGGNCIDDADALRAGGSVGVRNCVFKAHPPCAPSCAAFTGAKSVGQAWIVEAGELAGIHQSRTERLKVWLLRRSDTYREPYRERPKRILRHWMAIGTGNDLMALPSGIHWQQAYCVAIPVQRVGARAVLEWMDTHHTLPYAKALVRYRDGGRW